MKQFVFFLFLSICVSVSGANQNYEIIHNTPSVDWRGASPMGNGRLGLMVEGGAVDEVIHLNEDTLWSGEPVKHFDGVNCRENLGKVRELLFKGDHAGATALGQKTMLGEYNQCYLPMGQLKIHYEGIDKDDVKGYRRVLNLNRAVSTTEFVSDGVKYTREVFVSHPDEVVIVRLRSSKRNGLNVRIDLDSLLEHWNEVNNAGMLVMRGRAPVHADPHYLGKRVKYDDSKEKLGMRFATVVKAGVLDGKVVRDGKGLRVVGASECVIRLAARTSFNGFDKSPSQEGKDSLKLAVNDQAKVSGLGYDDLLASHIKDYAELYDRVVIELGDAKKSGLAVSDRVGKKYVDGADPDLDELFYQFGRYLLISSSRLGSQPANLQGIWSYKINPSWSSNWTINCNTEFNYIGSGASGLGELNEPFLRMIEEGTVDGGKVAKSWYGSEGWVIHHNQDLWRSAMPVGGNVLWATFPLGGTWCVVELYDQWRFDGDLKNLKRIHRLQRGNVAFWLDQLVKHPTSGEFVSSPDVYFENVGTKKSGEKVVLCSGPISSTILIRQLFVDYIASCDKLGKVGDGLAVKAREMLGKMAKIEIGKDGEIRQWHENFDDDWREGDATQLLVMVGAIYSDQIHPRLTPELADSLLKMIERRELGMRGEGSWRAAFPANTYARLGRGDRSKAVIGATYRKWVNPNLTTGFIQSDWQIDCNLGLMGAMQECLIQSHGGEVVLLPALPSEWSKSGHVKGMRARGGFEFDFEWVDGRVTKWAVRGKGKVKVRVNGVVEEVMGD